MAKSIKVRENKKNSSSFGIFFSGQKVNLKVFCMFPHFQMKYAWLKFTESNNNSHYSSAGRSLQHGVSGHTNQCGWLRLSALFWSWSSSLAVPLSFNENWSILCFLFVFNFKFWYENINISNTSRRGGWTGLGTAKVGCFPLFSFYPTFLPPGHVVPDCLLFLQIFKTPSLPNLKS